MKINNVNIEGLRGVRYSIDLPFAGKSVLLYGDNGSGKSSISDVIEWFYRDKVEHLSDEEIGRNGLEAMRNVFLTEDQVGSLTLNFTTANHNAKKSLEQKSGKLKSLVSNDNAAFKEYLAHSSSENLILRYADLINFVVASKTDRLRALSTIIGYGEIIETRDTLRTVRNGLAKEIKTKAFDDQINHQQAQIIEQYKQNITSDKQFIDATSKLIEPFDLGVKISKLKDINAVLPKIQKPDDSKEVAQENFLVKVGEKFVALPVALTELQNDYDSYAKKYHHLTSDLDKLKKLSLEKLLSLGREILDGDGYDKNDCPICLQDIKKADLVKSLGIRITELVEVRNEQTALGKLRGALEEDLRKVVQTFAGFTGKELDDPQNAKLKEKIVALQKILTQYSNELKKKPESGDKLTSAKEMKFSEKTISDIQDLSKTLLTDLRAKRKADPKWEAYSKIKIAGHAYAAIARMKKEKAAYEAQLKTLEAAYNAFQQTQKAALEIFLDKFSKRIDAIYQFLNPGEKVENIRLVSIEKEDELQGVTIQFDFLHSKSVSPPHKFLSESHVNCVGIAFFLASVEAFNKKNKFLVLDDVISSFDVSHRKRFADLLIEQYSDYQIIVLTHEKHWFDIVNNLVRQRGWFISTLKHDEDKGTHVGEPPEELRSRIEKKVKNKVEENLGNDARKYLEHLLKDVALNLEVKVTYKGNDQNEDRMAYELLTELKATLDRRKCTELNTNPIISRLLASMFIGNKDSHDAKFVPKFADMKAFWDDVTQFEQLVLCEKCGAYVSLKHFDSVGNKIRCKDGTLSYSWKK